MAHKGAVIEIPGIEGKARDLSLDMLNNGMERQSKPQGAQGIPLLHTPAAVDAILTQMEKRLA